MYSSGKFLTTMADQSPLLTKGTHQGPAFSQEQKTNLLVMLTFVGAVLVLELIPSMGYARQALLGFDFRRLRSLRGRWRPQYTPKQKKRTALLQELKEVFRRSQSQPVEELIAAINPKLRGWVNYFRIGHAGRCFGYVQRWVELKVRRHLMRARQRRGFGWQRWSRAWLYQTLGLFADYRLRRLGPA